jgi:hypothetical protein
MCFLKLLNKTIIIPFILIFSIQMNAQDSVYNHNGFLLELGYSLPQFKENYIPARIPHETYPYYQFLETKVPGFYSKSNSSYSSGLSYQTRLHNNFYFETGLFYFHFSEEKHRSKDSVKYYYLYPDSIKANIPYELANSVLYSKRKNNYFVLRISLNYMYKRFSLGIGFNYKFYSIRKQESKFIDRDMNFIHKDWFPDYYNTIGIGLDNLEVNLSYLIIKEKIPIYVFATYSVYPRLGIKTNLSIINFKNQ